MDNKESYTPEEVSQFNLRFMEASIAVSRLLEAERNKALSIYDFGPLATESLDAVESLRREVPQNVRLIFEEKIRKCRFAERCLNYQTHYDWARKEGNIRQTSQ